MLVRGVPAKYGSRHGEMIDDVTWVCGMSQNLDDGDIIALALTGLLEDFENIVG